MTEVVQYSHDNMPMKDILSEIREMVSREANARYSVERKQAKRELLILRPEARVDLLLQEAEPDIVIKSKPVPAPAPDDFTTKLQAAVGVSDQDELEALIRKVFREEMALFGGK